MGIKNPVETTINDSDEKTTHIETDTIKLQKRLNKKKKITKTTQQKMKQQILPKKMKRNLQKVDINHLQDQRKRKNHEPTPNPPIETKTSLKWKSK